jgi:hypothetical protein
MVIILNKDEDYHYLPEEIQTKIAESKDINFSYALTISNTSINQYCDISFQAELNEYLSKFKIPRICDTILSTNAAENYLYYNDRYLGAFTGNKFPLIPYSLCMGFLTIKTKEPELIIVGRVLSHLERDRYMGQLDRGIDYSSYGLKFFGGNLKKI